jgi:23S rRNA (pseudouridine1915-N3)-methyltransferase
VAQAKLLVVSDGKEEWQQIAQNKYQKKISPFIPFEIVVIKPFREAREQRDEKQLRESEKILQKIEAKDYVVLCDEKGKEYSSVDFSKRLLKIRENFSSRRLVFVIGGAYGASESLRQRADETICLSKMTMNHHVAQLFLLEQIYRAFTILNKIPYHNA